MKIKLISDSRKVEKGDTFIAIKHLERDGHDYIEDAIKNGASKIICERGNYSIETEIVKDTSEYYKNYLYENYYPIFKDIKLIGVTGTNGKTTTCFLTYQLLNLLGMKTAYIGTVGFYCDNEIKELPNTTPAIETLYSMFLEAKDKGCKCIVMEVSSHALDMDRVYGLEFDEVAFTNLTQDHIDYHGSFDNYANAKKLLFSKTRGNKIAIINSDDSYHERFILNNNTNIAYGTKGDLVFSDLNLHNQGTEFKFTYKNKSYNAHTHFVGKFNVYNYLMALLLVTNLGYDINEILKLSDSINHPPGRMDMIKYKTNSIFIDYAHTPDAVDNAISSALEFREGKIITIIGCGGSRDIFKRPQMGFIATEKSDYAIFTDDNPREDDEQEILDQIVAGVKKDNYEVIINRKDAIYKGMDMLNDKDILLILGKGHEDYQIFGHTKVHFSDKETVLEYIENKK